MVAVHAQTVNLHVALMLSDSPQERRCISAFFSPSRGSVGLFEVSDKGDPCYGGAGSYAASSRFGRINRYEIDMKLIRGSQLRHVKQSEQETREDLGEY